VAKQKMIKLVNGEEVAAVNGWGWPFQRINSGGDAEYSCEHGVGHGGMHGCDGCCHKTGIEHFKQITKRKKK
jgi:hypothetical protein